MFGRLFLEHPAAVGESYGRHFAMAAAFGVTMTAGGIACILHAFVPGICRTTASDIVRILYVRMVQNRRHAPAGPMFEPTLDRIV